MQPHREWNAQHTKWLERHYDEQYQLSYWKHFVEGQGWIFFDWIPRDRADSGLTALNNLSIQGGPRVGPQAGLSQRVRGQTLIGTYNSTNPYSNSQHEILDPTFYVRPKSFFMKGRVFSVLFSEAAGTTFIPYNDSISIVKFGEKVYTQVRRFIVVRQRHAFCYAVPIFTYGNQGTKKPGVEPEEHAVAYSYGLLPTLLHGEAALSKQPICIVMNEGEQNLSNTSRIFFGIHHPIQYNVKVKDLGHVHPNDIVNLTGYWNMQNQEETNQAREVTVEGADETDESGDEEAKKKRKKKEQRLKKEKKKEKKEKEREKQKKGQKKKLKKDNGKPAAHTEKDPKKSWKERDSGNYKEPIFAGHKGMVVVREGFVLNSVGTCVGKVVKGDATKLIMRHVDEDGDITNSQGKVLGRVRPLKEDYDDDDDDDNDETEEETEVRVVPGSSKTVTLQPVEDSGESSDSGSGEDGDEDHEEAIDLSWESSTGKGKGRR